MNTETSKVGIYLTPVHGTVKTTDHFLWESSLEYFIEVSFGNYKLLIDFFNVENTNIFLCLVKRILYFGEAKVWSNICDEIAFSITNRQLF